MMGCIGLSCGQWHELGINGLGMVRLPSWRAGMLNCKPVCGGLLGSEVVWGLPRLQYPISRVLWHVRMEFEKESVNKCQGVGGTTCDHAVIKWDAYYVV